MSMLMTELFYGRDERSPYGSPYGVSYFPEPMPYTRPLRAPPPPYAGAVPRPTPTRRVLPEVELRVPGMCCTKCEDKVREVLLGVEGVYGVVCDGATEKVTVTGHVNPNRVLDKAKRVKKKADFWSGTIYSQNFRDFIKAKTRRSAPVRDFRPSYSEHTPSHGEIDSYQPHDRDYTDGPSYSAHTPSHGEIDSYQPHDRDYKDGPSYSQYTPFQYGEIDSYHMKARDDRLGQSPHHHHNPSYGEIGSYQANEEGHFRSSGPSYSDYTPSYERSGSSPVYRQSSDSPSIITNPNYFKRVIVDY